MIMIKKNEVYLNFMLNLLFYKFVVYKFFIKIKLIK